MSVTIPNVTEMRICSTCDLQAPSSELFCMSCGSFIDEPETSVEASLNCQDCGSSIDAGEIFCPSCGSVLNN